MLWYQKKVGLSEKCRVLGEKTAPTRAFKGHMYNPYIIIIYFEHIPDFAFALSTPNTVSLALLARQIVLRVSCPFKKMYGKTRCSIEIALGK